MALDWTNKVDGVDDVKAKDVNDLAHAIQDMEANPAMHPYINSTTGYWMVWNATTQQYEDSGVAASGFVDANVIDSLNSQSATDALSANQGYILNGLLSHDNLLDNPWFTINQRGLTTYNYASGTYGYSVDRWFLNSGNINLTSSGISLTSNAQFCEFKQWIENYNLLNGKTVTLSVKIDNIVYSVTKNIDLSESFNQEISISGTTWALGIRYLSTTPDEKRRLNFRLIENGTTPSILNNIQSFKLELGSISTLENDSPSNYYEELIKCQWHFIRIKTTGAYIDLCDAITTNATSAQSILPFTMRTNPTITYSGNIRLITFLNGTLKIYNITGIGAGGRIIGTGVKANFTTTGITEIGHPCIIQSNNDANAYIDFSAEL